VITPIPRQILAYAMTQILTETGLAASHVHSLDGIDIDPSALPDVVLMSMEDKIQEDTEDSAGGMVRDFEFSVAITAASTAESATDTLASQIRKALMSDPYMGGLILDLRWDSQEWGTGSGSTPLAMTRLTFTAPYAWRPEW
jgi:hypothetical protein